MLTLDNPGMGFDWGGISNMRLRFWGADNKLTKVICTVIWRGGSIYTRGEGDI